MCLRNTDNGIGVTVCLPQWERDTAHCFVKSEEFPKIVCNVQMYFQNIFNKRYYLEVFGYLLKNHGDNWVMLVTIVSCSVKERIHHLIMSQLYCLWETVLSENKRGQNTSDLECSWKSTLASALSCQSSVLPQGIHLIPELTEAAACWNGRRQTSLFQPDPRLPHEYCQQAEEGNPSPLFSPGEVTHKVLCPLLGCPVQERRGAAGGSAVKGTESLVAWLSWTRSSACF